MFVLLKLMNKAVYRLWEKNKYSKFKEYTEYREMKQGGQKTWKPGITLNLINFENNLEKPGILYKSHGKTWNFVQKS